jgi:N-acetylglutamate synthase-like GNAT family acetyltransferase
MLLEPMVILQEFEQCYEIVKPAEKNDDTAFIWYSGIPHFILNAVMHLSCEDDVANNLDSFFRIKNVPVSIWVHSQNRANGLVDALKRRGFQSMITCSLMAWQVKPTMEPRFPVLIASEKKMEIYHEILAKCFQFSEEIKCGLADLMERATTENYLVYDEGNPVGTGTLCVNGKTGAIFNDATLHSFREKGCGIGMMQFLMQRAHELALERLIVLSAPDDENSYHSLGFQKILEIEIYAQ